MVKFSNKGKGRPTKRMDLKKKYKIKRKVKQHNKKLRRQAKKMREKGLRHKKNQMKQALPNLYPFKQQILNQHQQRLPPKPEQPIIELSSQELGLSIQSKQTGYIPRTRQNATKKYITNWDKFLQTINTCLFLLDARVPKLSRDKTAEQKLKQQGIRIIYILAKSDSVDKQTVKSYQQELEKESAQFVHMSIENKSKSTSISSLIHQINNIEHKEGQTIRFGIVGKGCTGKATLARSLMKYMNGSYLTDSVLEVMIQNGLKFIDAPFKLQDNTHYPLFTMPNDDSESKIAQEEQILKQLLTPLKTTNLFKCPILDKDQFLMHYEIQNFISIDDMLKKVGKTQRVFGKGGMVDTNKVRIKILGDWFTGKLNHLIAEKNGK